MASDPRRKGMPRRTPQGDAFREAVYDEMIDEMAGAFRPVLAGELHAAKESCWRAGRTKELLFLATGIHEHGDPCLFCGQPGEEVEPWFPPAAWLDRLRCPAGHQGIVLLLVCRACCKENPSPHGGADTSPTRAAILRSSRGSGPMARWMTEGELKGYIATSAGA
jgi:hypothetical protein